MLFLHKCLDAVGDVLLEVVVEKAVVVQVVALGTEEGGAVGGDAVDGSIDGGDDDGATEGVNAGIGQAGGDELTLNGERAEIGLDGGVGVVALPVDGVDADAAGGEGKEFCLFMFSKYLKNDYTLDASCYEVEDVLHVGIHVGNGFAIQ